MPLFELTEEIGVSTDNYYTYCKLSFVKGFERLKFHSEFYALLKEAANEFRKKKKTDLGLVRTSDIIANLIQNDCFGVKVE